MTLDRLRMAVRENQVSFPSQVRTLFPYQRDVQWRLVELYFIHDWSCTDLSRRYGLSVVYTRRLISQWARRAVALGYLQDTSAVLRPAGLAPGVQSESHDSLSQAALPQRLSFGESTIDMDARIIRSAGRDVHLTPGEWTVLEYLVSHLNGTVHRYELANLLGNPKARRGVPSRRRGAHSLRHFIINLRRKLEPDPQRPRYLVTESAIGYRLQLSGQQLARQKRLEVQAAQVRRGQGRFYEFFMSFDTLLSMPLSGKGRLASLLSQK